MPEQQGFLEARDDFRRARRSANLEEVLSRLTGKSSELLCYADVRQQLKATETPGRTLKDIPLNAIVGSVGRCGDFTRSFLPQHDSDEERWAKVEMAMLDQAGLPPITVYQIGDVYFVLDGHHRVSVARQFGATAIQAYVTEVETSVPLQPDTQPDDLIIKAEYADFLARTHLDDLRPGADLSTSVPGQYEKLLEHISVHRWYMGEKRGANVPFTESATHWYDDVYLPVVQAIRERAILQDFPGRTEADLYLWVSEHREELKDALGWEISTEKAASDLSFRASPRRIWDRVKAKVKDALLPDEVESGPRPGQWRQTDAQACRIESLFADVLVAVDGGESGWHALQQALEVARRERGRIHGLHITTSPDAAEVVRSEFLRRCEAAGISGELAVETGEIQRVLHGRSWLVDLVVLSLSHPPADTPSARLTSGLATLIRRSPRPVLAVPADAPSSAMDRILLAYDGSAKAQEALFAATYLAGSWHAPLDLVTAEDDVAATIAQAVEYAERCGVRATPVGGRGPAPGAILRAAQARGSNLLIMGGYGRGPLLHVALGSAVDGVLREIRVPVLICQ